MNKAFIAIHCDTGKENPIIRKLMEIKGVSEVTGTLGLYDIIAKVEAQDSKELESIITTKIRRIPNVLTTMTLMVI
ncbi:Lrp/AsnC family transcriptional regulator [Candidatus Nitrosotalea bavarica]|uniref:Lrp/AsnC family transcriptional regulator n=1 Tax=Candidatus Nitrosotalea bavarica TaxID=1903277 RepID=UPI000C709B37|nr:Lrp/AsnC ligand binding domain-containing protein [Candidatus Nitrosotalea bavarica]